MQWPTTPPVRVDCPECGPVRWCDEDGCCHACGRDLCWVYANCRVYVDGPISRAHWYRVVLDAAKEFDELGTPAQRQWIPRRPSNPDQLCLDAGVDK